MSTLNRISILRQSLLFSNLTEEQLSKLVDLTTIRTFKSGEAIFWEGDKPEWFYIVASGQVKVLKHSSQGKEFIIAFFFPGEMFGEVAIFENKPYPASAQAVEATTLLGINNDNFLSFITTHPRVALRMINVLSGRLREAQGRLKDLAGERVEQRLYTMLFMLNTKLGNTLPFTRQEIADMAGTTTETAIRVMSRLKEGNIITSTRGRIVIVNETKLRLLSEGAPHP